MQMTKFIGLGSVALTLCVGSFVQNSFAGEYFVEKATGSNISSTTLQSATELFKISVSQSTPDAKNDSDSNRVIEDETKAIIRLRPKLVKLGESIIVDLAKIEAKTEKILFSAQLKAAHADELDLVIKRLTRTVINEDSSQGKDRLGEVTHSEATPNELIPAKNLTYFEFGPAFLGNLNQPNVGYLFSGGYSWDVTSALVRAGATAIIDGSAGWLDGHIGGTVFFQQRSTSPYLLGDFGFGFSGSQGNGLLDGEKTGGFMMAGGAGVQFFRNSTIHVDLGIRLGFLFKTSTLGIPYHGGLHLGLYF